MPVVLDRTWRLETRESSGHEVQHLQEGEWKTWMVFGHGKENEIMALRMIEVGSVAYEEGYMAARRQAEK